MASENIIILILCLLISLETNPVSVNATCTWPPDFVDRIWTDSLKGNMDFTSTTMNGWTVSFGDQHINNWECVTYNTSGPFLAMKSNSTFLIKDNQRTGYRCLKLEKITDFSYRYYQMEPADPFSFDRLYVSNDSSLSDTNVLCTLQPATGSEFQMMLRKGYEGAAAVTCPYSLLADYNFTYQQSDGTVSCDSVSDVGYVGMCSNGTQFNVPSLTCSPYPFYTSEDTVWCVDVVVVGTDTFVSLYNGLQEASSIDETNTYRFTCVGINAEGTSMSVTPQHCKANQSPTEVPINNAGNKIGAVLSLRIDGDTCLCNVPSPPSNGTVTISDDLSEAVYTCGLGFTIQGPTTRKCQSDGSGWSYMDPVCVECPALSETGGIYTLSSNGTKTTATLTCSGGYVLVGSDTVECQSNGSWTTSANTSECVSTSEPAEVSSSANSWLEVVIVVAILTLGLAVALGGLVFYIRKLKKTTIRAYF